MSIEEEKEVTGVEREIMTMESRERKESTHDPGERQPPCILRGRERELGGGREREMEGGREEGREKGKDREQVTFSELFFTAARHSKSLAVVPMMSATPSSSAFLASADVPAGEEKSMTASAPAASSEVTQTCTRS